MMTPRIRFRNLAMVALLAMPVGCRCQDSDGSERVEAGSAVPVEAAPVASGGPPPQLLYLPDGGDVAPPTAPDGQRLDLGTVAGPRCPAE